MQFTKASREQTRFTNSKGLPFTRQLLTPTWNRIVVPTPPPSSVTCGHSHHSRPCGVLTTHAMLVTVNNHVILPTIISHAILPTHSNHATLTTIHNRADNRSYKHLSARYSWTKLSGNRLVSSILTITAILISHTNNHNTNMATMPTL